MTKWWRYQPIWKQRNRNKAAFLNSSGVTWTVACVASVPVRSERNSGHAKGFFAFGPREKWGESKKSGRKGVGEGTEGNACLQSPGFWKTRSPTNGAPDWCGVVILIDKCINFAWMIPVITRAWLTQCQVEGWWTCASFNLLDLTWMARIRIYSEDAI